jgi:metal-responsive CopG/Arc/MetJ family transcriptional regulator
METIRRIPAGVMFESDVLAYVDLLAAEHRRSRSFIINVIVRTYAREQEQRRQQLETSTTEQRVKERSPIIAF